MRMRLSSRVSLCPGFCELFRREVIELVCVCERSRDVNRRTSVSIAARGRAYSGPGDENVAVVCRLNGSSRCVMES